jgi:hypothetical protein
VLDAVGFERPASVSVDAAARPAIHFSATHPELVSGLVLVNSYAHYLREDDYLCGFPPESLDRFVAALRESWGTGAGQEMLAPSRVANERFRSWYARSGRVAGGPDFVAQMVPANFGLLSEASS